MNKRRFPDAKVIEAPKIDQGGSAAPERRCKNCACFLQIPDPTGRSDGQGVCRRNAVIMMNTQNRITGAVEMNLTFAPTLPDLVCFDGWRPADTPPGVVNDWTVPLIKA